MAVRSSMAGLIAELRLLTSATLDEFTDQRLQNILDGNKIENREMYLRPTPTYVAGGVVYTVYDLPELAGHYFETVVEDELNTYFYLTGTDRIPVVFGDGDGEATFDPYLRRITFNTDTHGKSYYLNAVTYDLNGAAAEVWNIKCSNRVSLVDIKTDNHTLALSQEREAICSERIKYFSSRSLKAADTRLRRTDQAYSPHRDNWNRIINGFAPLDWSI